MSKNKRLAANRKKRLIIRTIVLLVLAVAIVFAIVTRDKVEVLAVGDIAPDFELVDLEGNKHRLSDYKGEGVFLNFWGSWCGPCKTEMPYMENQYKEFEGKGVHILAINLKDTRLKAETFRDQFGLTFPIARDPDESVRRAYNVMPLPTTILINKDGIIKDIITRGMSEDEIRSLMESIQPE
jgi:peroxiredoxin